MIERNKTNAKKKKSVLKKGPFSSFYKGILSKIKQGRLVSILHILAISYIM